jgi:DNA-directed RNA polymerase specialized sigma24 family protein
MVTKRRQDNEGQGAAAAAEPKTGTSAAQIRAELPYLRRYARALSGNQEAGDRFTIATLEAILQNRTLQQGGMAPRIVLFRTFHCVWTDAGTPAPESAPSTLEKRAQIHMSGLTPNSREALLLSTIEEFSHAEISQIMQIDEEAVADLIDVAYREMQESVRGKVMIIEDEALIALDLRTIVEDMGHEVAGVARTVDEAIALGRTANPDLILSDIQLADGSCGIDAVNVLLERLGIRPVIFITAFPERLLTGEKPEPALLIAKPFRRAHVRSAISQGMFFSTVERLLA